jgi:cytochrome c peroxidase
MLRNAPGLFDLQNYKRFHYDGEFSSLEDLVKGTFSGRPMGWLPGEENEAFANIQKVVVNDPGYVASFKQAYQTDLNSRSRDEVVNDVARAVTDFLRTIKSNFNSPYDEFVKLNKLESQPQPNESAANFSANLLEKITTLEKSKSLQLSKNFNEAALLGLKIFFNPKQGNCAECHAPPLFTDQKFHNLGISQIEYDQVHGEGAFAALKIPDAANALRPTNTFRQYPTRGKPNEVDLGYWNFANLKTSPMRDEKEDDNDFLRRMIGAMKTPPLRHLAFTFPYMHNGAYTSLEATLQELLKVSDMARAGKIRAADEALKTINLKSEDIAPLVMFLNSLNEEFAREKRTTSTK